jgi:hypothetical protein
MKTILMPVIFITTIALSHKNVSRLGEEIIDQKISIEIDQSSGNNDTFNDAATIVDYKQIGFWEALLLQ